MTVLQNSKCDEMTWLLTKLVNSQVISSNRIPHTCLQVSHVSMRTEVKQEVKQEAKGNARYSIPCCNAHSL